MRGAYGNLTVHIVAFDNGMSHAYTINAVLYHKTRVIRSCLCILPHSLCAPAPSPLAAEHTVCPVLARVSRPHLPRLAMDSAQAPMRGAYGNLTVHIVAFDNGMSHAYTINAVLYHKTRVIRSCLCILPHSLCAPAPSPLAAEHTVCPVLARVSRPHLPRLAMDSAQAPMPHAFAPCAQYVLASYRRLSERPIWIIIAASLRRLAHKNDRL